MTLAPDGSIWFATNMGASRFDGTSWTTYTTNNGLINNDVLKIAIGNDNTVWFATQGGLSNYNPATLTWEIVNVPYDSDEDFPYFVAADPAGQIWIATTVKEGMKTSWPKQPRNNPEWENMPIEWIRAMLPDPAGGIWFGKFDGTLQYYNPQDGSWKSYDYMARHSLVGDVVSFALAEDGSIWIGSGDTSPTLFHLLPGKGDAPKDTWSIFEQGDGLPKGSGPINTIGVLHSNEIWYTTRWRANHCIFP